MKEAQKFIEAERKKVCERYGYVPKLHPCEWQDEQLAQEPWPEEPFGHMAGGVQPPQRPWVGLTEEELYEITNLKWWDWEDSFDINGFILAIEAKLKEKNT